MAAARRAQRPLSAASYETQIGLLAVTVLRMGSDKKLGSLRGKRLECDPTPEHSLTRLSVAVAEKCHRRLLPTETV